MRSDTIRGNVFVANLPRGLTNEQLAELFDPYGMVLSAYLARDPASGETLGHGLVQLAPDRAVDAAVAGVTTAGVAGRRIDARRADPGASLAAPVHPRGSGWSSRPASLGNAAQDRRAPNRPAPEVRMLRIGRPPSHATEWNRAHDPHTPRR